MKQDDIEELIAACPTLYHMAERGSWSSIKDKGLLSTSALLDAYGVVGQRRAEIESSHRPQSVEIVRSATEVAVVRDQKPMSDDGLRRCLPDHLTPQDWYRILNKKVFFWLTEERLHSLTNAQAYRDYEHDVLEVSTRSIIESYRDKIWLCPYNSGATKPFPHPRDENIFKRIEQYPYQAWRKQRQNNSAKAVVELAVDHSVPDISRHVERVVVKKGDRVISILE